MPASYIGFSNRLSQKRKSSKYLCRARPVCGNAGRRQRRPRASHAATCHRGGCDINEFRERGNAAAASTVRPTAIMANRSPRLWQGSPSPPLATAARCRGAPKWRQHRRDTVQAWCCAGRDGKVGAQRGGRVEPEPLLGGAAALTPRVERAQSEGRAAPRPAAPLSGAPRRAPERVAAARAGGRVRGPARRGVAGSRGSTARPRRGRRRGSPGAVGRRDCGWRVGQARVPQARVPQARVSQARVPQAARLRDYTGAARPAFGFSGQRWSPARTIAGVNFV